MPLFERNPSGDEIVPQLIELQGDGRWEEALALIQCTLASHGDSIILRVNQCLCQYHLGKGGEIFGQVAFLVDRWPSDYGTLNVLMLGLLCAHEAREVEARRNYALALAQRPLGAWDLPTIPAFISEGPVIETKTADQILPILSSIREHPETSEAHRGLLDTLLARYEERERAGTSAEAGSPEATGSTAANLAPDRLSRVLEAFFQAEVERPEAERHLRDMPEQFEFRLIKDLGYKVIYTGEGPTQSILVHVWNYEVSIPPEGKDHNVSHRAAMEASMERGRRLAQNPPRNPDPSVTMRLPHPIFMVDGEDFGGIVSHYYSVPA